MFDFSTEPIYSSQTESLRPGTVRPRRDQIHRPILGVKIKSLPTRSLPFIVILLASALPARLAADPPARSQEVATSTWIAEQEPSLYDPQFVRSVVEYGYSRMSRFTEANGTPIVFELTNFTTYHDHKFDTVIVSDIITPPGGETIQVVHKRTLDQSGEVTRSSFEPSWENRPRQIERPQVAKSLQLRLDQVIARNAEVYGGDVLAVTSYDVSVALGERHRSYRAAIIWIATEPDQRSIEDKDLQIQIVDHVTKGLSSAFFSAPPSDSEPKASVPVVVPEAPADPKRSPRPIAQ